MVYWIAYYIIKMLGAVFSPRIILGREHVPPRGSFIIAGNHASNLDPFLIGLSFNRRISYMAKDSLFRNRILRFLLRRVEAFPVRRGASDVRALRETLRRLKRGLPVIVFPGGTRKASGTDQKARAGIGFLALKGKVPVLPVYIGGSDRVLPPGAKVPKRGRVTVSFGKPLIFSSGQSYPEIAARIMQEIQALSGPA